MLGRRRLNSASCVEYNAAGPRERLGAVRGLTKTVGRRSDGVRGATLTDEEALRLLDGRCSKRFARHFLLYEIYIRAVGLRSVGAPPA